MSRPRNFAFHAISPAGDEAVVIRMDPPDERGCVAWSEWPAEGFASAPREGVSPAEELVERVRSWERAGWRFTEPVGTVLAWIGR